MQQWQYKITVRETKKLLKNDAVLDAMSDALNDLGGEGWELVNFAPFSTTQGFDLGGVNGGLYLRVQASGSVDDTYPLACLH